MRKSILYSLLVLVVVFNSFVVLNSFLVEARDAGFEMQKLKYEPYPATPGEYFDLWLKVENVGNEVASNASFELMLEYPFSLHPDYNAVQNYGAIGTSENDIVVLEYKLKVDEDAVEGTYELKLKTCPKKINTCTIYPFEIAVENVRTDFDVVVQESSAEAVSLAIANTGKNPANSLTVKIPEQDNFKTAGVADSIVGNVDSGDYTIVSFVIQPKNIGTPDVRTLSEEERQQLRASPVAQKTNLEVQLDYTDIIGERRTVIKNVQLNLQSALSDTSDVTDTARFQKQNGSQTLNSLKSNTWFWVSVILFGFIGVLIFKIVRTKKKAK